MDELDGTLGSQILRVQKVGGGWELVTVDGDYDGEWFQDLSPFMSISRAGFVVIDSGVVTKFKLQGRYLHQLVAGKRKGYWIRHKNGNKLDNRSVNLEHITPKEIMVYRREPTFSRPTPSWRNPKAKTYSQYRGVVKHIKGLGYYAKFSKKMLGYFPIETDAARAYDEAALARWGQKAIPILNFPEEVNM